MVRRVSNASILGTLVALALMANVTQALATGRHTYLYVAAGGEVQRFPFVNGRVSPKADLTLSHLRPPIAIGPDGSLYAASHECLYCQGYIRQFAPGSNVEKRRIILPFVYGDGSASNAFLTDAQGRLYVGYTYSCDCIRGRRLGPPQPSTSGYPSVGLYVYSIGARENDPPLLAFAFSNDCCGPMGLAFDANGRLYATIWAYQGTPSYRVVADVLTNPREVFAQYGHWRRPYPFVNPGGIAVDGRGAFVLNEGDCCTTPFIDGWSARQTIHEAAPFEYFNLPVGSPTSPDSGQGIALYDSQLYVPMGALNAIWVYPEFTNGVPAYSIPVAGYAQDVKIGP